MANRSEEKRHTIFQLRRQTIGQIPMMVLNASLQVSEAAVEAAESAVEAIELRVQSMQFLCCRG